MQHPRGSTPSTFEGLIVDNIRDNILTESNIRDLVKIVDEEMDGVAKGAAQEAEGHQGWSLMK